jgi:hypothetical protein
MYFYQINVTAKLYVKGGKFQKMCINKIVPIIICNILHEIAGRIFDTQTYVFLIAFNRFQFYYQNIGDFTSFTKCLPEASRTQQFPTCASVSCHARRNYGVKGIRKSLWCVDKKTCDQIKRRKKKEGLGPGDKNRRAGE